MIIQATLLLFCHVECSLQKGEDYTSFSDNWSGDDRSGDIQATFEIANRRDKMKLAWQEVPLVRRLRPTALR